MTHPRRRLVFVASGAVMLSMLSSCAPRPETLTVFAAASTAEVMTEIADAFTRMSGEPVRLNFASSGMLARQIEWGAQADVFLSASPAWTDYLVKRGLADPASLRTPMGNALVLVAYAGDAPPHLPDGPAGLPEAMEGRLSIGDPAHVPAGVYAQAALTHYDVYTRLKQEDRLLPGGDARATLAAVELGACELGIVYATDARLSDSVTTVYTFPPESHPPIRYTAMVIAEHGEDAQAFLDFLCGPGAAHILEAHGFNPVSSGP